ncbi:MAG TPA: type II toxin-antitoxin system RelE/ParE family toxin [Terriglobales bacterium]|nr:type II toxin-antitoxin system RelE/ParE family toxin [Terriglobales bacterium]
MIEVLEYLDAGGRSPYRKWFDGLNAPTAAKVAIAVTRLAQGNFSNIKSVGAGVFEYRLDFGPGYRIYFGKDGERLMILLGGGTKSASSGILGTQPPGGGTTRQGSRR